MTSDVKEILNSHFRCSKLALQMNESTDVTGLTVSLVYFYCIYLQSFQDGLFEDHFNTADYRRKCFWINTWKIYCAPFCTDNAKAIMGCYVASLSS